MTTSVLPYILVYYNVFLAAAIVILTLKNLVFRQKNFAGELLMIFVLNTIAALLTIFYQYELVLLVINLLFTSLSLILCKKIFKNHSYSGLNFYIGSIYVIAAGLVWGANFLLNLDISIATKLLLICTTPLILFILPSGILQIIEQFDTLCRSGWSRPNSSYPDRTSIINPAVSLLVPTYSEPPELVIETLNKLAELDYKSFEVLVVDNNTKDQNLWKPVREHCQKLGKKFRFFHIENLGGAKAGALNWAHQYINPAATVVGVIDADYHAKPDFLKALVGYFDDPDIGFVQTPHDYRDWENNIFQTMCYWEYKIFFHSTLINLNERCAALTVGTMCLIRKKALEEVGGWAEWCVTEDSELAVRIHDVGYTSVYVRETFGKGLIPETFESYKKQRYRWSAGPVQELRYHFSHLTGLSRKSSSYNFLQRLHHLNHGINNVIMGLSLPTMVLGSLAITSMIFHEEIIHVPFELWLTATVMLVSGFIMDLLIHRTMIKPTFKEYLLKWVGSKALFHVITLSTFKTTFTGDARWERTNKFKTKKYSYSDALYSTKEELIIGITLLLFITISFFLFPHQGLALMFLIGFSYVALSYFSAPLMSLAGAYSLNRKIKVLTEYSRLDPDGGSESGDSLTEVQFS